ncbi:MAG TPA: peptide ABC transporter substrate-binding protein [Bellilinea sp.]
MPRRNSITVVLLLAAILLTACNGTPTPTTLPLTPTDSPSATPTATPEPPSALTVCLGREPLSLYLYGGSSRAQWSVLEAVYDGPFDRRGYVDQPVILTGLPSLANGDALTSPVTVQRGQMVLDANGNLAPLETGLNVLPSGCSDASCAVAWDGASPLEMNQQRLTYRLIGGLTWSDGTPLTAADSVYSFKVASDPATPVNPLAIDRTESYTALDEITVVWTGVPGYRTDEPAAYFFIPLPQHAYSSLSPAELLTADQSSRTPLGWGPYIIESWTANESIQLTRNPNYFRASEGLPRFDKLTFRFLGDQADNNLAALVEGECDIVDETTLLEDQLSSVRITELDGRIQTFVSLGPEWEHLDFGVQPAAYDAGLNPFLVTRQDFFGDIRVRQAFAACIDRQALVSELLFNQSQVADGFFPPDHPLYAADLPQIAFDPAAGAQLLDQAGWLDSDNDPATPRLAAGVANVLDGTPLAVTYATTSEKLRVSTAARIAQMLGSCGVKVTVQAMDTGLLYAPGPDGILFGRNFDLAQFAWQSGRESPCFLFTTPQIPAADNGWLGVNITGWSNPAFDAACQSALDADPGSLETYSAANRSVQELFIQELPVLPLYYTVHLTAARPDLCGLQVDSSARSEFWNLESLATGGDCP